MDEKEKEMKQAEEFPAEEKQPFVPSPKWKRVFAWILFVIVILSIASWLLNIASPGWVQNVKAWLHGLFF